MAYAVLVLGLLLFVGGLSYLIYTQQAFQKSARPQLQKKEKLAFAVSTLALSLGAVLIQAGINLLHPDWKNDATYPYALFAPMAYIGIFGLAFSNVALWLSFNLYYYKPKMDPRERKFFRYLTFAAIPFVLGFFLVFMEGVAPYLSYPLVSGFAITSAGFEWTRGTWNGQGFHVAWYALIMLFGVCVCYWICDHRFYKEFHKHGILDNLTIFAFICGVVGARVWYVVGNWTRDGFDKNFMSVFQVWKGGLTIMGGALGGIIGGVAFMMIRRKYVNVRWAMDICIPTILLAQCIGRWGNFFNQEVYGNAVNIADGWGWLPLFIQKQMQVNLADGQIHVPLFLIEGAINLAGYFLIAWGAGKGLKRYLAKGDLGGLYFIWYGIVRMSLEGLRDSSYNMGADNEWSVWSSLVYVIIGLALILFCHLLDLKEKKIGGDLPFFLGASVSLLAVLLSPFLTGIKGVGYTKNSSGVITTSEAEPYMGFNLIFGGNGHSANVGLIIAYALLAIGFGYAIYAYFKNKKEQSEAGYKRYLIADAPLIIGVILFFASKSLLGFHDGTGDFGTLTNVTISYNLGPGFILLTTLSLTAIALLAIPFVSYRYGRSQKLTSDPVSE